MLRIYLRHRGWVARLVTGVAVVIMVTGAAASANPSKVLGNPSEVQYGYDPIVDPGGSQSGQMGSSEPVAPGERVEEAAALVAAILGGTGDKGEEGGVREPGIQKDGVGRTLVENEASGKSSDSSSVPLIAILVALSVGLAAWAVAQRRSSRGSGRAEMAIRPVSFVGFLAIIVLLNGFAGSILG